MPQKAKQGSKAGGQSGVGAVRHLPRMAGGSSPLSLAEQYSTRLTELHSGAVILKTDVK